MLEQFRLQYPNGCLNSQFLGIEHGLFVVCVTITVEGLPLGSGLAAAPTLEVAEDRARMRALATLLTAQPAIAPTAPAAPSVPLPNPSEPVATPIAPRMTKPPVPVEDNGAIEPELPFADPPEPSFESLSTTIEPSEPEAIALTEDLVLPLESMPLAPEPQLEREPDSKPGRAPVSSPVPVNPSSEPIDFSEVIARSNRELKRLGWTSDQGRDHLMKTYGKRSRQLLSDEELLEFVQFLEKEPSPLRN